MSELAGWGKYAGPIQVIRTNESEQPPMALARRMRALGADEEEIIEVLARFHDPADAGELSGPALLALPDLLLRDQIASVREEWEALQPGEVLQVRARADTVIAALDDGTLWTEAWGEVAGTIETIKAWVGDDPGRAKVMTMVEEQRADEAGVKPRSTLLAFLAGVTSG